MIPVAIPESPSNLLTHSRMTSYKTCQRKHYYGYELGIRRRTSAKPLRMGSAVHEGLDQRARGASQDDAILAAVRDYEAIPEWCNTDELVHGWMIERETVVRLLCGYWWYWDQVESNPDYPLAIKEIVQSEVSYRLPILNPDTGRATTSFEHGGKRDQIVTLRDGRLMVRENKTCSEDLDPESDYWKRLLIDQQISGYYTSALDEGFPVVGVLYNVIRKPVLRPSQIALRDEDGVKIVLDQDGNRVRTKDGKKWRESGDAKAGYTLQSRIETPEEFGERLTDDIVARPQWYFARREIPRLESDLQEYRAELWQIQLQMRESQRTGRWFRNTAACRAFGSACPYFSICTSGIDVLRDGMPDDFEQVQDVHPELAEGSDIDSKIEAAAA